MNVFVLWGWQISAIETHAGNTVYDESNYNWEEIGVMHITTDYDDKFVDTVLDWYKKVNPNDIVINHSTVPIGTNQKLAEVIGLQLHHSPIRWLDYKSIRFLFIKYTSSLQSAVYLRGIGIEKVEALNSFEATEVLKLLDDTQTRWNILFAEFAHELCKKYGLDYGMVYEDANYTHNDWYRKLDQHHLMRPILNPPEWGIYWERFDLLPDWKFKDVCKELNQNNIDTFIQRQKDNG
jgi:hypothetical protein